MSRFALVLALLASTAAANNTRGRNERSSTLGPASSGTRRERNELLGVHVDVDCMNEQLGAAKPCANGPGGSNCGQCVLVLGFCKPSPPKIVVDSDCMVGCLTGNSSCAECVDVQADCEFGANSPENSVVEMNKESLGEASIADNIQMLGEDSDLGPDGAALSKKAEEDIAEALAQAKLARARGEVPENAKNLYDDQFQPEKKEK
jgi:hypothetical protein